jgi:tetratricopeptide (TPR) repeat protein
MDPWARAAEGSKRGARILAEGHGTCIELERVIRELSSALQLVPSDMQSHMLLAEAYSKAYDWTSAVFSLRFVLHSNKNQEGLVMALRKVYMLLGKEMMIHKKYEEAAAHIKNALKYDPTFVQGWTLMAKCFVHLGEYKSAVESVGRSISLAGSENMELFVFRAKLYWALGLESAGNTDMRRALEMDKTHPEVVSFVDRSFHRAQLMYNQGMERLEAGCPQEALHLMEGALLLSKEDIKLYLAMAKICRLIGELDRALFTLQDAAAIYKARYDEDNPKEEEEEEELEMEEDSESETGSTDGDVDMDRTDSFQSGGDESFNDNDSRSFQPAEAGKGGRTRGHAVPPLLAKQINLVYNDMALRLAGEGDYAKAINLLHRVIGSERERAEIPGSEAVDYRYLMNRGDCYRAQGENLYASADYHSALELKPDAADIRSKLSLIHYQAAVSYFNASDFKAASSELDASIRLNGWVCEYFILRGRTHYYQGYYHDACEDFKQAHRIEPANPRALEHLSLFGHGALQEAGGVTYGPAPPLGGSQSADSRLHRQPLGSPGLDGGTPTPKKKHSSLNKSKSLIAIVRTPVKEMPPPGPKAITAFLKKLPPLDGSEPFSPGGVSMSPMARRQGRQVGGSPTPLLSAQMIGAMHEAGRVREESFRRALGGRCDLLSKDSSWGLLDTAKRQSEELLNAETKKSRADDRRRVESEKRGATTVTSLKRMSMDISRASVANSSGVLAGVVSRRDDPALLAMSGMNLAKKSKRGAGPGRARGGSMDDASSGGDSLAASSLSSYGQRY